MKNQLISCTVTKCNHQNQLSNFSEILKGMYLFGGVGTATHLNNKVGIASSRQFLLNFPSIHCPHESIKTSSANSHENSPFGPSTILCISHLQPIPQFCFTTVLKFQPPMVSTATRMKCSPRRKSNEAFLECASKYPASPNHHIPSLKHLQP